MNKSLFKKLASLVLATGMILSLAACSGSATSSTASKGDTSSSASKQEENLYYNKTGLPICDDTVTLTLSMAKTSGYDESNTYIQLQEYEKRLGIKLECSAYNTDDWTTQLTLMMTNGELTDLIACSGFTVTKVNEYGKDGYFANLNNYKDLMPNLNSVLDANPTYKSFNMASDGGIYGLVKLNASTAIDLGSRFFINKNWLAKVGMSCPTTVDELYTVLKAFKEQDANNNGNADDEIPLQYSYRSEHVDQILLAAYGIHSTDANVQIDTDANGKVRLAFMSDNYKQYLQYLAKLYKEGLMDQEAFSSSKDQIKQKYKDGIIGAGGEAAPFATLGVTIDQDKDLAYAIGGLTSSLNSTPEHIITDAFTDSNKILVSAESKHIEAACRFVDYLFTWEGAESANEGYQDVSFEIIKYDLFDGSGTSMDKYATGYDNTDSYRITAVVLNEVLNVCATSMTPDNQYASKLSLILDSAEKVKKGQITEDKWNDILAEDGWAALVADSIARNDVKVVNGYPTLSYTAEEGARRTELRTDIKNYLTQAKSQFIIGKQDFETGWEEYISRLNQIGAQELLSIEQKAYDRYTANIG